MRSIGVTRAILVSVAILALCLIATGLAAWRQDVGNRRLEREAVAAAATRIAEDVRSAVTLYQYGLRGARGAVITAGEDGISRATFRRYSDSRDIAVEFPGAGGFGFVRRVPASDRDGFQQRARADGAPDFTLRQIAPHDGELYVIQYIEPAGPNAQAVGLDIASEPFRRAAAAEAMRSGEATLTAPITLVQRPEFGPQSFLLMMPVFRPGAATDTMEAREKATFGWVYAPLSIGSVLAPLKIEAAALHVRLVDVTEPAAPIPFFEVGGPQAMPGIGDPQEFRIFGRQWRMEFEPTPLFVARLGLVAPATVGAWGVFISVLLAALAGIAATSRHQRRLAALEERRLATIVENSSDPIIGETLDGRVVAWNRAAERVFGYAPAEVLGQPLAPLLIPPERRHEDSDLRERVARDEIIESFDTVRLRRDGAAVDVSIAASAIRDAAGQIVGMAKMFRDVGARKDEERRQAEFRRRLEAEVRDRTAELTRVNSLLAEVLRAASEVSIIATDVDGVIRIFNRGAERMLGYTAEEMVGKNSPAIIHVAEEVVARGAALSAEYRKTIEGFRVFVELPERVGAETRGWTYVRKDGTRLPVSLVVTAMRDAQGEIIGYLGIAQDVTERFKFIEELRRSNARYAAIFNALPIPASILNNAGEILATNPASSNTFGYSPEDIPTLAEWRSKAFPDPEYRAQIGATWSKRLQTANETGRPFEAYEARITTKSGEVLDCVCSTTVLDDGSTGECLVIIQDVTVQKRSVAALQDARVAADAANIAKSQFLAMMSHELRTPMAGVLGMAELLLASELRTDQRLHLVTLTRSAQTLLDLLNDILDFAKIEAGRVELEDVDFSLARIIEDIGAVISPLASQRGNRIATRLPPDLLGACRGDAKRYRQILMNLVGNANKFTTGGTVTISLDQRSLAGGRYEIRTTVSDTGIGMSRESQARLFQPFVQGDVSTARKYGGTGLGLVISKRLTEFMGGAMSVESELGRGSTFSFTIVVGPGDPAKIADLGSIQGQSYAPIDLPRPARALRILVAEDNDTNRLLLTTMLSRIGHSVDAVENGELAVTAVGRALYDIILMDMQMPVMDGETAMRRIRATDDVLVSRIPIVALTADAILDNHDRYRAAGANTVVTKPVDWRHLSRVMDALVTGAQPAAGEADAGAAPRTQAALLDVDFLAAILRPIGRGPMNRLVDSFLGTISKQGAAVASCAASADPAEIRKAAHALKGMAAQFGAIRLADAARAIEKAGALSPAEARALTSLCEETAAAMTAWRTGIDRRAREPES